ncbi:MAG: hypothetical protein HY908_04290, partial [Myxococcales bacterium]|nr:hypothetical protein [Myxococcales bacterium]
ETHRAEFERLAKDEPAYLKRVHTLFAEEAFAPLRFNMALQLATAGALCVKILAAPHSVARRIPCNYALL